MNKPIEQNDITIGSWSELCETLYVDSWQKDILRFRTNYAFRGVSDKDYRMSSSFMRSYDENVKLEYHLLRNFRKYARMDDQHSHLSDWRLITIAQHHGLPTRLLDWTYSPFIAAHFATWKTDKYDRDAAIWLVDFVKVNQCLPDLLKKELERANVFTMEMLEIVLSGINDYDTLSPDKLVLFFEPPSLNPRIVNQYALFSVMSSPVTVLDDWLLEHPEVYKRIIIPRELKWEIRDKLDQANISERILFPGLDGLASWLKRQYLPLKKPPR